MLSSYITSMEYDPVLPGVPLRIERYSTAVIRQASDRFFIGISRPGAVRFRVPTGKIITRQGVAVCAECLLLVSGKALVVHASRA